MKNTKSKVSKVMNKTLGNTLQKTVIGDKNVVKNEHGRDKMKKSMQNSCIIDASQCSSEWPTHKLMASIRQ